MSTVIKNWSEWLVKARFGYLTDEQKIQTMAWLYKVRDKILENAKLMPGDTVLDIGTGMGLLAFGAYDILKDMDGKVIASDYADDCLEDCKRFAQTHNITNNIEFLKLDITNNTVPDQSVNVIVMKSVLVHILDKVKPIQEMFRMLKTGGKLSFYEPIVSSNTKYYDLVNIDLFELKDKVIEAEDFVLSNPDDPLTNFNERTLIQIMEDTGFVDVKAELIQEKSTYIAHEYMIEPWFNTPTFPGGPSTRDKLLYKLTEDEATRYINFVKSNLSNKEITVVTNAVYMYGRKW